MPIHQPRFREAIAELLLVRNATRLNLSWHITWAILRHFVRQPRRWNCCYASALGAVLILPVKDKTRACLVL